MWHCRPAATRWHNRTVIEKRPFRRGTGPYTLDYRGWDQDRVVVVRLQLDGPCRDDAAAIARALNAWLSEFTFSIYDAPQDGNEGAPMSGEASEVRERSCGGCRLTWFSHGDSLTVSICSGGEDGLESASWCCEEIVAAVLRATPDTQVSWREWREREFADLESIYFQDPGH